MSYFKTNNILGKLELSGFDGIDLSSPAANGKCTDMVNLRILPDRSIAKRDGFAEKIDLGVKIRAVLSGDFNGEFLIFAVARNILYKINTYTGVQTVIGSINSDEGPVSIFCYSGDIYVIDGSDLFEIRGNTLVRTEGYAPLIGKDWGNNYSGEIYEPLNMLTPKGRISYIVQDPPTSFLSTHYEVERVDAVYVNGELRDPETYGVDKRLRWLSVSGLSAGDRVLAYYTFVSDMKSRETLCKNPHAMVFGGINNSRIFVWGGEDKKRMFASAPVSQRSLEASALVYPDSGGIYFPESNNFCVGDGKHDIRAVSRHYDRLLIFTSGDTWMADSEVSSLQMFPLTRINTDVGCASIHGVAKCGNDPISVGHGNIYRWTSNTDTLEDCNARIISDGIKDILPSSFFEDAVVFTDRHNSEVLFAYRDTTEGCVLVYSIPCNSWYIYRGISVDHFFEGESSLGFVNGGKICLFERGRTADSFSDGSVRSIYGYCTYSPNSFGHPTRKKRISGIMGIGELKQKELKITFESERGITESVSFAGGDSGGVECFYKRLRGERFKTSKIKISTDPTVRQRIYSLTVTVRP